MVKLGKIYSPTLQLHKYRMGSTGQRATLAEYGENQIIVPIGMLKDHVESDGIRATEIAVPDATGIVGITRPAPAPNTTRAPIATHSPVSETVLNDGSGEDDEDRELEEGPAVDDDDIDNYEYELTSEDIELLRASQIESHGNPTGRTPLCCDGLDDAPTPGKIVDVFCCVIGDIFHAMDRPKVPVKHESKKGYFVALREAFLAWDEEMLNDLESRMRADGMYDEQISNAKYYQTSLFKGCVRRRALPPSLLYWRVRATYALYGNKVDSKTGKPLFNARA